MTQGGLLPGSENPLECPRILLTRSPGSYNLNMYIFLSSVIPKCSCDTLALANAHEPNSAHFGAACPVH